MVQRSHSGSPTPVSANTKGLRAPDNVANEDALSGFKVFPSSQRSLQILDQHKKLCRLPVPHSN
jgi:hypothetical protein